MATGTDFAAYHGTGWEPRRGALVDDIAEGRIWRPCGVDSEWGALQTVLLTLPDPEWPQPPDWNAIQYLDSVDFQALRAELVEYGRVLSRAGITVLTRELDTALYNGIFTRDQFIMTPEGAIVARMGSTPRRGEERWISADLTAQGIPILATVRGSGCFEGADALWLNANLVAIGIGNRTDREGARQISRTLGELAVSTALVPLPRSVQHLLGLLQIVAPGLAAVRSSIAPPELLELLDKEGFDLVDIPETRSVQLGQAMNFVVVDERRVVMVRDRPDIESLLAAAGISVVATVHCTELIKAAGGLACATGIVSRRIARTPPRHAPIAGDDVR